MTYTVISHNRKKPVFQNTLYIFIDKVGFNRFQFQFESIKSDCLNNHLITPKGKGFVIFFVFLTREMIHSPTFFLHKQNHPPN